MDPTLEHLKTLVIRPGFLGISGELGGLIAELDWSRTSLGPIETWPEVLKTTVALILQSPVPIVTLWGDDGVMVYNDSYARFAGNRHPQILGLKVLDAWPEAADWNRNVMEKVYRCGEVLSFEDQVLALDRHGRAEPAWMNLDYSRIVDDDGVPVGVIAIVVEPPPRFERSSIPTASASVSTRCSTWRPGSRRSSRALNFRFEMANQAYLDLVGRDVVGKIVAEALPEVANQGFVDLLKKVWESRESFVGRAMPVRLTRSGRKDEERFVDFVYQPMIGADGAVSGIFIQGYDVTDQMRSEALRIAHNAVLEQAILDQPLEQAFRPQAALDAGQPGCATTSPCIAPVRAERSDDRHSTSKGETRWPTLINRRCGCSSCNPCSPSSSRPAWAKRRCSRRRPPPAPST